MRTRFPAVVITLACLAELSNLSCASETEPPQSPASATILESTAVRGILGRTVRGADGKEMGRVIDVVVDVGGQVRAAVIDFGGFLGVGSRKIAVDWGALQFGKAVKHGDDISLALTQDQLKAAPEYKEGNTVVVIGSSGQLKSINSASHNEPEQ